MQQLPARTKPPVRQRCRMSTANRGNAPPRPRTIPVPPAAKAFCSAVPAKRKTPSGGVATATPPARIAHRTTTANRECGVNAPRRQQALQPRGLLQAAKLHQAAKPPPASARPSTKHTPAPPAARAGCKSAAARAVPFGGAAITPPAPTARTTRMACRNRMSNLHPENLKEH